MLKYNQKVRKPTSDKGVNIMFGWRLELDIPTIIVLVSAIITLLLQLILCFKCEKILLKLIPFLLLVISTVVFSIIFANIRGWDGIGYLFFAYLSFALIFVCGIGWGIWAIFRKRH